MADNDTALRCPPRQHILNAKPMEYETPCTFNLRDVTNLGARANSKACKLLDQYVLLLVDASSHPFTKHFVQDPLRMRERVHYAVKRYMAGLEPKSSDTFRIVVRAYAAMNKIPQGCLVDFFARFSSADPHFDFTILLGQSSVEQRIANVFSAAQNDHTCKHILVAAQQRRPQFALPQPSTEKVTLVQGVSTRAGNEAPMPGLPVTAFPYVFRT